MKPLYMWAGGKNKMIPKYLGFPGIPVSGYDSYVEPFFGGGAMMIWMHKNNPNIKKYIINDVKSELIGIYKAIKTDCTNFTKHMDVLSEKYLPLEKTSRKSFYYDLRTEYTQDYEKWNPTQESATLYFLMKTAFNGIWQSKKDSNGRFATPCGLLNQKNTVYDVENVKKWEIFLQNADIFCGDWKKSCEQADSKTFFFMDPPYRDSFTSYGQEFSDAEHQKLIEYCVEQDLQKNKVFYCNRDDSGDGFFDKHRAHLYKHNYEIKYTAGRRSTEADGTRSAKNAKEILIYSPFR